MTKRTPRIYVDTSVIGGCLDEEFREGSERLFARFRSGEAVLVISDLTRTELAGAPPAVRQVLATVPAEHQESLELNDEARALAERYVVTGVVGESHLVDAQHIALASAYRVDALVSWNFRHIVNLDRIRGYNAVNLLEGYPMLEIRTPAEVIAYDAD